MPELDARLTFQSRETDANGDPLGVWGAGFSVFAKVDWLRGSESAVSNRLQGLQPVTITIRDSEQARTITNAFRAVAVSGRQITPGQEFNLTAVTPAQEIGFINIMATAGGAAG